MSHIARSIAFPASGAAAWPVGAPPPWRGGKPASGAVPPWWQPGDVLALDFANERYMRLGAAAPLASVLATARAGEARCIHDGVEHVFAAHEPVVVAGHGAEIWGALTNTALHSRALDDPYWTAANLAIAPNAAPGPDGVLSMEKLAADGSAALHTLDAAPQAFAAGTAYVFQAVVAAAERSRIGLRFGTAAFPAAGRHAWFDLASGMVGGAEPGVAAGISPLGGGFFLVWISRAATASAADGFGFYLTEGGAPAEAFAGDGVSGLHVTAALLAAAAMPLPPVPTGAASVTRPACDCTIPDFAALASAAGLDGGFAGRCVIDLTRLSDSTGRFLWSFGVDADNRIFCFIANNNKIYLRLRAGGVNLVNISTDALSEIGEKQIDFQVKQGAYTLAVTGVPDAVPDDGMHALPALTSGYVGSDFATSHLNGALKYLSLRI
ncbi:MAG: hypothetical protein RIE84_07570 [Parvibaculum sp.]|uniref:phage head spike fiber domain-containing protein n=2 Tax=Parvibaculum sp. TaxID=2024848 RepID=UPI0032EC3A11